ncbi:MAG TPA: DUF4252 domain-containing protein [Bryobacteraceae bacterium]|jgi:hypothetical protein|nr:DUF4252 domain-containing protein [Bryobacteraceae bacterium]
MKNIFLSCALLLGLASSNWAASNDVKFPVSFGRLSERATESVDVTLDSSMLQLASGFLSQEDQDEAHVKKLIGKLRGVYVRSFEFDKEGQYSMADVEAIRDQLKVPTWTRIVGVHSLKGDNSDVFVKKNGDAIAGLVVIATEPKELTVVHIDGAIDPQELSQLSGHMGIPQLGKKDGKKNSGKEEE